MICINYGIYVFLKLIYFFGVVMDIFVMIGFCNFFDKCFIFNIKCDIFVGFYNCIWFGFEWQICSDDNIWINLVFMLGGFYCISYGVNDYMDMDDILFI